MTTDSQKEKTDERKSIDLCGATDSAEYNETASAIGNDLHKPNLQVVLLPRDIVSVAIHVKFNSNFNTKFKTKVKLNIQFQKLGVM